MATRAACHCFAAPSVCSLHLSLQARQHTTSVVAGKDVIPRLCYASVRRLLRRLNNAAPSQPVMRAISAALGGRDKTNVGGGFGAFRGRGRGEGSGLPADEDGAASIAVPRPPLHDFGVESRVARHVSAPPSAGPSSESRCQGEWDDLEGNRGLELRDHAASDFLVQPGLVIHLGHLGSEDGPTAEARHPTAFTEIPISTRMMTDHVPMVYQSAIDAVIAKRGGGGGGGGGGGEARARRWPSTDRGDTPRTSRRRRRWRRRRRREERREEMREERRTHRRRNASGRTKRRGVGSGGRGNETTRRARGEDDDDPGRRLWANVRRSLGIGVGVDDDRSESSSGRRRRGRRGDDSTDASEEDDIIAGLAELFGLDDDGEDDERDADGDGEFPGDGDGDGDGSSWDGSSSAPSTPRASPRARDGIARAPRRGDSVDSARSPGKFERTQRGSSRAPRRRRRGRGVPRRERKDRAGRYRVGRCRESGGASREVPRGRAPARRRQTRIRWRRRRRRRGRASTGATCSIAAASRRYFHLRRARAPGR